MTSASPRAVDGRSGTLRLLIVVACLAACFCVAGFLAIRGKPEFALLAAVAAPMGMLLLAWPNLATWVSVFLIYVNFPVIIVRFHGLPFVVGAAIPMLLAVPLAYYLFIRSDGIKADAVFPLIALFFVVNLVGLLVAVDGQRAMTQVVTLLTEGVLLFFLVTNAVRDERTLRGVVWSLLLAGSCLGALSVFQWATRTYSNDYGGFAQIEEGASFRAEGSVTRRQSGPLGNKNRYAQIMSMLVPLGLFTAWSARSQLLRVGAWGATALTMMGVALTFCRGAAVAFAFMMIVMFFMRLVSIRQCLTVGIAVLLLVLAVPQLKARLLSLAPLLNVVSGEGGGIEVTDGAVRGRAAEMLSGVMMFVDYPLTGVGPAMYPLHYWEYGQRLSSSASSLRVKQEYRQPHSLYPGLAAELGAPGLILFLLIVGSVMRKLAQARQSCLGDRPEAAMLALGFFFSMFMYLATGLFAHFSYIRYFWLMLGLAAAAARILGAPPRSPSAANG